MRRCISTFFATLTLYWFVIVFAIVNEAISFLSYYPYGALRNQHPYLYRNHHDLSVDFIGRSLAKIGSHCHRLCSISHDLRLIVISSVYVTVLAVGCLSLIPYRMCFHKRSSVHVISIAIESLIVTHLCFSSILPNDSHDAYQKYFYSLFLSLHFIIIMLVDAIRILSCSSSQYIRRFASSMCRLYQPSSFMFIDYKDAVMHISLLHTAWRLA